MMYFFLKRYMESFIAEMKEFVQSIRENTSPPVTGIDGRIPVVIGMAAKKSYLEHRPVRLSEIAAALPQPG
jgi:myo-inositol 2-dehydrogenase/D-chiro-inositol 1-dehydrogenase